MSAQFETFGKYVLLEKLATGGMAEVFLARGTGAGGIGKFFAIKRILPQYADSPEFIDMFKAEAKIAINLSHSNIVSIHEFGVEKGQFFLVMDYVEGRNLRQILNKMKKSNLQFSIDQIVFIIKEVAAGLDHAHRCIDGTTGKPLNITHRDMSPQNVMVSFEGEVKIVDFGIAKAESQIETTRAGTLKGKFGYMSPEQAEGLPVDLRTDIFSLGIVLWELLANDRLFMANNEINTLRKIRDCQIPSLRKVNPNIHAELERITQKSLARDRNLRHQTGAALHRELNRFLNRQYPDFSAQDFSVFIKSVFADEILSIRKRLVEYTKLNVGGSEPIVPLEDRTAILDPGTSSLAISQVTDSDSVVTDPSFKAYEATQTDPKEEEKAKALIANAPTIPEPPGPDPNTQPSFTLDDKALKIPDSEVTGLNKQKSRPVPLRVESPPPSNVPARGHIRRSTQPSYNLQPTRRFNPRPFLITVFAALGIYSYLVRSFSPQLIGLISATDPYLGPLHSAIGVNVKELKESQPVANLENPISEPVPVETPPMPPQRQPATPTQAVLSVSSTPSGAEIIINGKSTGSFTPASVRVDTTNAFSVALKKKGYFEHTVRNIDYAKSGGRLELNLKKSDVGYLDIEFNGPTNARITVNGEPVLLRNGRATGVPVLPNTRVVVRALSSEGQVFDTAIVRVGTSARRAVHLNFKNSSIPPR